MLPISTLAAFALALHDLKRTAKRPVQKSQPGAGSLSGDEGRQDASGRKTEKMKMKLRPESRGPEPPTKPTPVKRHCLRKLIPFVAVNGYATFLPLSANTRLEQNTGLSPFAE